MCYFTEVWGEGEVLFLQLLTIVAIGLSIVFWIWFCLKHGFKEQLKSYTLPIIIWTIFGTLDIVITAKGTFLSPYSEGNFLARFIFVETGFLGPVLASILWVALWAWVVFALNKLKINYAGFLSLAVFWSLAIGHFFGFSSWFAPFCEYKEVYELFLTGVPSMIKAIVLGFFTALTHYVVSQRYLTVE
jgi:hypothetical protein